MQFVYLLIGVAILIAWFGPTVLITLVVIGIVGLIVYALKGDNKTIQEPLANRSNRKDSKPIATITSVEPKENSSRNILTPIANDSFIKSEQDIVNETSEKECMVDALDNKYSKTIPINETLHHIIRNDTAKINTKTQQDEIIIRNKIICNIIQSLITSASERQKKNENIKDSIEQKRLTGDISKDFHIKVPFWEDRYIYSVDDLSFADSTQRLYYYYFKKRFLKGYFVDIKNNTNYAFLLMYDLCNMYHSKPSLLKKYYQELIEICPKVESYTIRILKDIEVFDIRKTLKQQLLKYSEKLEGACKWIVNGEEIEIHGIKLCRGGFYIGDCFKLSHKVIEDNKYHYDCGYIYGPVINPDLPIKKGEIGNEYFCSYQDMTPQQRYAYLQWLSGNTPIEDTCVDLIQYYVYGLEIRLFIDKSTTKERKQILFQLSGLYKELKSLDRNVCGDYYQLVYSIRQIISAGIVKYYPSSPNEFLSEDELMSCDDYIDYMINQELKGKTELTSEDAYSVAKKIYLLKNLPIALYENNIKEKFILLFQKRFKRHPIIQRHEHCTRNIHYIKTHTINSGNLFYSEDVNLSFELPKLSIEAWLVKSSINEIISKLQEDFWLYNNCIEWANDSTPLALLQLPKYIELGNGNKIDALQECLYSMLDKCEYCLIDVDSLLDKIGYIKKDEKSLYLQSIQAITNGLKRLKIRTVPLIDVDSKRLNFGDKCVLYKIKGVSQVERTDTYQRLELFVKLVMLLIQADVCNDNDIIFVEEYIDSQSDTSGNTRHLKAYFRWLQHKKLSFDKKTKDSIGKLLSKEQCKQFAHLLVKLSCNQGDINNKRVDVLTKLFPLLGENVDNIHSQIHRMLIDDEDFATVEVTTDAKEYVITQSESQSKHRQKTIKIDTAKLSKLEAQTASAQNMLSEIFNEEENVISTIAPNQSPLITILTRLLTKSEWSKAEVDSICKEFNVITGSILEQINDYAYDKVDDAVIEDDDDIIYVNTDYKDQLV